MFGTILFFLFKCHGILQEVTRLVYITKERNGHHRYALSANLVSRRLLVRRGHNVTFFVSLSLSISLFSKSERTIR